MPAFAITIIISIQDAILVYSRWCHLVTLLRLVMVYCSVLSITAKLTKVEDASAVEKREDVGIVYYLNHA